MAENAAAAQPKPTSSVKLVLLGEAAVGKSSLVLRFVNNEFQDNKEPTIGAAFLTQRLGLQSRTIKFEIWDTAGQERFASLAPMYYRNAQAALVVYDLTKASSLTKARHWVAELQRQANPGIVIALVGNKFDLVDGEDAEPNPSSSSVLSGVTEVEVEVEGDGKDTQAGQEGQEEPAKTSAPEERQRKVSTKEAKEFADEEGLLFFETSAKTGGNVHEVFAAIAAAIPETALKTARNAPSQAAQRQQGTAAGQDERVNLNQRGQEAAKDSCAC